MLGRMDLETQLSVLTRGIPPPIPLQGDQTRLPAELGVNVPTVLYQQTRSDTRHIQPAVPPKAREYRSSSVLVPRTIWRPTFTHPPEYTPPSGGGRRPRRNPPRGEAEESGDIPVMQHNAS